MSRLKSVANTTSGILGFAAPAFFAYTVYANGIPQNVATWGMTVFLDAIGLMLVFQGGNKRPFLQIGWLLAATCIFTATLFSKNEWHWGTVETVSLVLCLASVVLWQVLNAKIAIFAFIAAFICATIPLMVDYWYVPLPSTTWLWLVTIVSCSLSIYGAKRQDVEHTAIPWGAIALNGFITFLCVR